MTPNSPMRPAIAALCLLAALGVLFSAGAEARRAEAGRLVQASSGKCVIAYPDSESGKTLLQLDYKRCFDPAKTEFEFGYEPSNMRLHHKASGKCAIPETRSAQSEAYPRLILGDCAAGRAKFLLIRNGMLLHAGGKCVRPDVRFGDLVHPHDHANLVLDEDCGRNYNRFYIARSGGNAALEESKLVLRSGGQCMMTAQRHQYDDNTKITMQRGECDQLRYGGMYFRMLPNGAIQNVKSGKCVHPQGDRKNPPNNTRLVLRSDCSPDHARFYMRKSGEIQHIPSKKCIHPRGGSTRPEKGTEMVLHDNCEAGARVQYDFRHDPANHRRPRPR